MPKVLFSLVEQDADIRLSQKAYRFTVENQGSTSVALLSITPRIPEQVNLVEVKDPSLMAVKAKYLALCSELTEIFRNVLFISNDGIRSNIGRIMAEFMDETFGNVRSNLRVFLTMIGWKTTAARNMSEKFNRRFDAFTVTIENKSQADAALDQLNAMPDMDSVFKQIFQMKVAQLGELERTMGQDVETTSLATIEADSFYAVTYILNFPRSYLNPRIFNLSIEGSYTEDNRPQRHVGGATASIVITPKPYMLSIIAILSSMLGVLLKAAIETSKNPDTFFMDEARRAFFGPHSITAVILALVFFNIYEFTSLGKNFKMTIGWRSALLIGTICGLFADRILDALKAFVGG